MLPAAGQVTLRWADAGLGLFYRVYLHGPGQPGGAPVATARADGATVTGLRPGQYRATVVPVNFKKNTGRPAEVSFAIP